MKIQTFNIIAGTVACNARCPFCISKMTPKAGMNLKLEETNWINFHKACEMAKLNSVEAVMLTGKGEPLLYPKQITDFLKELKKYNFPIIEIQTNALVLGRDFEDYQDYLEEWRKNGLNTFVISVVHYKKEKNKTIYTPSSEYQNLEEVIKKLHNLGFSVRLNCILLKDYIDTVEEIENMVDFCLENEVEQLTLKAVETVERSEDKACYEWTQKRLITQENLLEMQNFLEKNAARLRTLNYGGVVYDYKGQNVCITDCLPGKPFTEDLRQLIFFPDGHLRYDWRYKGAILL